MSENLAKLTLDILLDFDYANVSDGQIRRIYDQKNPKGMLLGLTDFQRCKIYVKKGGPYDERRHTQLHELAHVYYKMLNKIDAPEEVVDALADKWMARLSEVE